MIAFYNTFPHYAVAFKFKISAFSHNFSTFPGVEQEKRAFHEVDDFGRPIVKDSHQLAAAQKEKNSRLKEAFGLSESFKDGSSFERNRQAQEKADEELKQVDKKRKKKDKKSKKSKKKRSRKDSTSSSSSSSSSSSESSSSESSLEVGFFPLDLCSQL